MCGPGKTADTCSRRAETFCDPSQQTAFAEQLARDKKELKAKLDETTKKLGHLADRMSVFSADSGVNLEDLERALDIVRRQREDPSRVKFIHGDKPEDNVPVRAHSSYVLFLCLHSPLG